MLPKLLGLCVLLVAVCVPDLPSWRPWLITEDEDSVRTMSAETQREPEYKVLEAHPGRQILE